VDVLIEDNRLFEHERYFKVIFFEISIEEMKLLESEITYNSVLEVQLNADN